jgi:hypothetical protein
MFCPNARRWRKAMNFGLRKRQMSREAVPAMRTRPESELMRRPSLGCG